MSDDEWILIDFIDQGLSTYSINRLTLEIRNNKTNRILNGHVGKKGYREIKLNNKTYKYHRIIALMFLPNPDNLPEIDHINHDKLDNRLENLRWVSSHDNSMNKTKYGMNVYNTIDSLPDDAKPLIYRGEIYDNFYFSKTLDHIILKRINDYQLIRWSKRGNYEFAQLPIGRREKKNVSHNVILREIYFLIPDDSIEIIYDGVKYENNYYCRKEDIIISIRGNDYIKYNWIDDKGFYKIHIIYNNKGVWISKNKLLRELQLE